MEQINKKGQVPNVFLTLIGLGLGLVVFTIIMAINGDVLTNLRSGSASIANSTNESVTIVVNSSVSFVNDDLTSVALVVNASSGTELTATDYSVNLPLGSILVVESVWGSQNVNVTYNYRVKDAAYNVTSDGLTGVLNITTFSPTFGTLIVLAGVLLLLGAVITAVAVFRS